MPQFDAVSVITPPVAGTVVGDAVNVQLIGGGWRPPPQVMVKLPLPSEDDEKLAQELSEIVMLAP